MFAISEQFFPFNNSHADKFLIKLFQVTKVLVQDLGGKQTT